MSNQFIVATVVFFPILLYLNMIWVVQIPHAHTFYLSRFASLCNILKDQRNSNFAILRQTSVLEYTTVFKDYMLSNCHTIRAGETMGDWELKYRPLSGDHIHMGYILYLDGERVILHDRNVTEDIAYDNKPAVCKVPGSIAYKKTNLHNGIHTHCDGIIHVHPWSAYFPVEGRDVTLGKWFKSVGIEDYNHRKLGYLIRGKYYNLNVAYYPNVDKLEDVFLSEYSSTINGLWLKDCHGMVVLYDDIRPTVTQEDVDRVNSLSCFPNNYPK
jgi:hypothetical protein